MLFDPPEYYRRFLNTSGNFLKIHEFSERSRRFSKAFLILLRKLNLLMKIPVTH